MRIHKTILAITNHVINLVIILSLIIAGLYAGYGLWDNHRIYATAQNVQDDMMRFKPSEEELGFEELREINSDVIAWLTIDNTKIDHPVLQGETNLKYFNTDVYGEFSLTGSIYLDSRNDANFTDTYSLIYGHHVANSKLFGDLDLFKNESFFRNNQTGTLYLEDEVYELKIFASLVIGAGEQTIFNPNLWQDDLSSLKQFTLNNNLFVEESMIDEVFNNENAKIVSLATCSTEFTDARTVVLALMIPKN